MTENVLDQNFWNSRWENGETGWDIGAASSAISEYFKHIENKEIRILIPGCGNAHEAELLLEEGFKNITLLDIAPKACELISQKFSHHEVEVICGDFFEHKGEYDVIVEQTFFCALNVNLRSKYVNKIHDLLSENGKIIGVLFNKDFGNPFPPFGGDTEEYRTLFQDKFEIKNVSNAPIVVENAWASCGCTVPEKPAGPIAPGKSAKIKVTYNAAAIAPINKDVYIQLAGAPQPKTVHITGEVLATEAYDKYVKDGGKILTKQNTEAPTAVTTPSKSKNSGKSSLSTAAKAGN